MRSIMIILMVALFMSPGISVAQGPGGIIGEAQRMVGGQEKGQRMMSKEMMNNMGTMSRMMNQMQQMGGGRMTPEQHQQMMDMMNQMGQMMQQMGSPQGQQMHEQHQTKLREMQHRLNSLKREIDRQH
jgi:hypothetical protein